MSGIHGDGRSIIGPEFTGDDGSAAPAVAAALEAYGAKRGSEHDVVAAIAASRLLVPVVADDGDMALPTLVGRDGRRAVLAFTGAPALAAWRPDARPVPVATRNVCLAALDEDAAAVLVDVAGPVPVTVAGARLAALAAGDPPPEPHADPDVLAAVHAATRDEPTVTRVRVAPSATADLTVELRTTEPGDHQEPARRAGTAGDPGHRDPAHRTGTAGDTARQELARRVAARLNAYLPGRLARGVAFAVVPEGAGTR